MLSSPQRSTAPAAPAELLIENVSKVFHGARQARLAALGPVSLEIARGEFVVLFGPSGCGKSTLLNLIAGFDRPSQGRILLEGAPVEGPSIDRLMMFQEPALFPWLKVIDNVTYGLRSRLPFAPRKRKRLAREFLHMVHLEDFENSLIHELSGGMKQRVALARVLAPDPKILLIDEPFPALDAITRTKLYGDLQEIFVRTGKTVVAVTHDPREAACLGDRIVILTGRPGRIKSEVRVDLPRPRDPNDSMVGEYAARIMSELEGAGVDERRR